LHPHLDRPFAFFGHSLGALVAFELSREIRRQHDLLPVHLFVSGCGAPQSLYPHPPIGMLPDTAFLEELRQLNGTPAEVLEHEELMQLLLPTLRADFTARETYAYADEPPLDCPISAFGGMQDGRVERDRLEAWRDQTSGPFSLHTFPGGHFFLHSSQSLLLQTLSHALEQHGHVVT
jgi:medium-chain acyl-[acyl-carrier-protein] hydrolase